MRTHLNEHCWNFRLGSVPADYLQTHQLTHCSFCHGLIHSRYHNLCPSCRPLATARQQADALRAQVSSTTSQAAQPQQEQARPPLPSLEEIHSRYTPTLKHVPKELRSLWARCVAKTAATTAWHNTLEAWQEQHTSEPASVVSLFIVRVRQA